MKSGSTSAIETLGDADIEVAIGLLFAQFGDDLSGQGTEIRRAGAQLTVEIRARWSMSSINRPMRMALARIRSMANRPCVVQSGAQSSRTVWLNPSIARRGARRSWDTE